MILTISLVVNGFLILPAIFGLLVIFHIFIRGKKYPADKSNVINHLRLVWFALTRENLFVDVFPWLKNDEYENVKHHHKDV